MTDAQTDEIINCPSLLPDYPADHPDTSPIGQNPKLLDLNQEFEAACLAGDYDASLTIAGQALKIVEDATDFDRVAVSTILGAQAWIHASLENHDKTEELQLRILSMHEKALGAEHPELIEPLDNLADLYFAQEDFAKTQEKLRRTLKIKEKTLGAEHPEVADTIRVIAL
ncbi:tetratricopeptide repeat protein, partial [Myxococcota bacterium]|nr:tetratricopeptide repeat protein [Myxococcota bacterium]